jgi:hypothetical protein
MASREERLAANEVRFRQINEEAHAQRESVGGGRFVCECADRSCTKWITMPLAEYAKVREHPRWFVIAPSHEIPDVEAIVRRGEGWWVIEKPEEVTHVVDPEAQ